MAPGRKVSFSGLLDLKEVNSSAFFAQLNSSWALYHALSALMRHENRKNPADPEKNRIRRESVVSERGKVHLEAGDTLLAVPIESTASMFLLSPFWWFAISQGSVTNSAMA